MFRDAADGHGNAAADAVAAVGPGGAGTTLGQVARERGVGDGRGPIRPEGTRIIETAAEAVTGGDATAGGCTDSPVADEGAIGDAEDRAEVVDAAAKALAVAAGGVGAAFGQVVEQRAVADGQRRDAELAVVLDAATTTEAIIETGDEWVVAAADGLVAGQGAVGEREIPSRVQDAATDSGVVV